MQLNEYVSHDAIDLANLVKSGNLSREDLRHVARDAIDAWNPPINAVVEAIETNTLGTEPTNQAAPLDGVPFLIKDVGGFVNGLKHEYGSRMAEGYVATGDTCGYMKKCLDSGLQIVGRSNTPEMAFNVSTENVLHGSARNPWNFGHSTGGSSGGAAAAVAAGIVPIAQANDGAGSIRIPAACCGVVGLKPSRGRVSYGPEIGEGLSGLSCTHVVSRSVRDSALMLDLTSGPVPGDPFIVELPEKSFLASLKEPVGSLTIGFGIPDWVDVAIDAECRAALNETKSILEGLGHRLVEGFPDLGVSWDAFVEANARFWCADIATWIDELEKETGRKASSRNLEKATIGCWEYGKSLSAKQLIEAKLLANEVSRSVASYFQGVDLWLSPTLPVKPYELGTLNTNAKDYCGLEWTDELFRATPFTPVFNVTGQPAISIPVYWSDAGLPIGVQLAGNPLSEALLLKVAHQIETAAPWSGNYLKRILDKKDSDI